VTHLVEVAFGGNRKEFFQWEGESALPLRTPVVVEADRGEDFGHVHSTGELAEIRCKGCAHGCGSTPPPRAVLRIATADDETTASELQGENEVARRKAMERVKANNLVMKVTDAEWQWDRRKLTFYFTAERRVDFRNLVRDLAAMFRTRIELKQIGVRDEAKRLSGIGRCGREYCSASWLPDLRPVNLGVAKDQKLSLNPQQISGACGRLMCCLRYEHEFYVQSRRRFPKEGRILQTSKGEEKVLACDIFNERVTLRTSEGDTRVVPLADLKLEIAGADELATSTETTSSTDDALLRDVAYTAQSSAVVVDETTLEEQDQSDVVIIDDLVPVPVSIIAVEDSVLTAGTETVGAPSGEPRRKRRRGRRGGRRLRSAEDRTNSDAAQANDGNDGSDSDGDGDENTTDE
jgi:cell fate regulator YaaT (PSP1 superfamily)